MKIKDEKKKDEKIRTDKGDNVIDIQFEFDTRKVQISDCRFNKSALYYQKTALFRRFRPHQRGATMTNNYHL